MQMDSHLRAEFENTGRLWFRNAVSEQDLMHFDQAAEMPSKAGQRLRSSASLNGALAKSGSLMRVIAQLDQRAKPVRVVAFNKSQETNWGVPWHQDRVVAVADKHEQSGYKNWGQKSGTWHCEPPQSILDDMLFVRVHLDDTDQENGAMEIALGSHAKGIVPAGDAETEAMRYPIETCQALRGDVLVLKMLTLHGSRPSTTQRSRRVLRIDFASAELPDPLRWAGFGN